MVLESMEDRKSCCSERVVAKDLGEDFRWNQTNSAGHRNSSFHIQGNELHTEGGSQAARFHEEMECYDSRAKRADRAAQCNGNAAHWTDTRAPEN